MKTKHEWKVNLHKLRGFTQKFGRHDLRKLHQYDPPLAHWVQRITGNLALLSIPQLKYLHKNGFPFGNSTVWIEHFLEVVAYREKYGHLRIPIHYRPNPGLNAWLGSRRHQESRIDKKQLLNRIGYDWRIASKPLWTEQYRALKRYRAITGDCLVPAKWRQNPALGGWVFTQRARYRKGLLSADKIAKLNAVGFVWDPLSDFWQQKYEKLMAFYQKHGHTSVPNQWSEDPQLGIWIQNQRQHKERLSRERIELLDKIGFNWDPHKNIRELHFKELRAFKKRFGHTRVPFKWTENPALGQWVYRFRQNHEKLEDADRIRLNLLNFDWDPLQSAWMRQFERFKSQKAKGMGIDKARMNWASNQRIAFRRGKLNRKNISLLNQIGFRWNPWKA